MERWPLSLTQESYSRRLRGLDERPVNVTLALRLGDPSRESVERRLSRISEQAPLLRASLSPADAAPLTIHDRPRIRLLETTGVDPADLAEHLQHDTRHVFAEDELLWKPRLIRLTDGSAVLSLAFHHIVFDGVSRGLFLRALGTESPAPAAHGGTPYVEFARWQRANFTEDGPDVRFWRAHLAGLAHNQHVNLGFARNLDQPLDSASRHESVRLTGVELWQILRWGRRRGVSLFTQVLAALAAALGEATGEPENVVRATFHGRPPGHEGTIGCFGQDVTLRLPTKPVGLAESLTSTTRAWNELGDHRFTPYGLVRRAVGGSTLPFRPVVVTLNSFSTPSAVPAFGQEATVVEVPESLPEEGLHIQLSQAPNTLTLECSYHPVRFAAADVRAFLDRVTAILREPHR
ncbi:condensation domain-containing protein [Streptomyces sp. NPDC046909]|uniref:condensation domain-containing protein n=1 Tax=Streptomyces sp. NPDC046909 TaxID=3155617 RepID=UPI0033E55E5D